MFEFIMNLIPAYRRNVARDIANAKRAAIHRNNAERERAKRRALYGVGYRAY